MLKHDQQENAQEAFLKTYQPRDYPPMAVAVDLLVFTIEEGELKLLLIRRSEQPFAGSLALPGVFVRQDETLDEAALRGIREETGIQNIYFEQLYTWGEVDRDPRMRIISVSYMALVPAEKLRFHAGERTIDASLVSVDDILSGKSGALAFDHANIISYARWRLKNKVEYTKIAFALLPEEFTLPQLQKVFEILLGKDLYKANFRNKISPMLEMTEKYTSGDRHRPSRYYRLSARYKENYGQDLPGQGI